MRERKSIRSFSESLSSDGPVYGVHYCKLQNLLRLYDANCYLAEEEKVNDLGWRADVYVFPYFMIITGYEPLGFLLPDSFAKLYDDLAKNLWDNYYKNLIDHEQLTNGIYNLLLSFKKGAEQYVKNENELNNFQRA